MSAPASPALRRALQPTREQRKWEATAALESNQLRRMGLLSILSIIAAPAEKVACGKFPIGSACRRRSAKSPGFRCASPETPGNSVAGDAADRCEESDRRGPVARSG